MVITHHQVGEVSKTEVSFGDRIPTDEEVRRVREILGIRDREPNAEQDCSKPKE